MARALTPDIRAMLLQGRSDEYIVQALARPGQSWAMRDAIRNVRAQMAQEDAVRKRGPWPVSYVRKDGERVFRVGPGHDIPERSLAAFGFEPAPDAAP